MWTHQKTEPWNMKQKWISPKGEIENSKLELGPSVPLSANDTLLEKKKNPQVQRGSKHHNEPGESNWHI